MLKKKHIIFLLLSLVILYFVSNYNKNIYNFEGNKFSYSSYRGDVFYNISLKEKNESFSLYKIDFETRDFEKEKLRIHGLLYKPNNKENIQGIVYLPGGGASKESRDSILRMLAREGYATLVIDQRGIGETGGLYLSYEQDYTYFSQGKEPMQHLATYDALRSYDILKDIEGIDKTKIIFIGESMGGRYAIIAGAIEKRIKGVITISSSGFDYKSNPLLPYNSYFLSIDPDNYVADISPNKFFILHGTNDTIIPLENAKKTFLKAKEPKKIFVAQDCEHGYCVKMKEELLKYLELIFKDEN
ncbi:MAG: alpha/beta hydrolase [Candidatus Pacearchaeota archaeon]|jgi:hypothetical protein